MRWCWVSPDSTDISASRPSWSTMLVTSSAISSDGSRASAAATARRCSSPPDRPPVSRSARPSRPTSVSSWWTSVVCAGRQSPHHVVGDPGAQHLALRVLHDHRGAAEPAEADGAGTFDGARGWVRVRPASASASSCRSRWRRSRRGARRVRRSATPGRARRGRPLGSGTGRRAAAPAQARSVRRRSTTPACARRESRAAGPSPATAPTSRSG